MSVVVLELAIIGLLLFVNAFFSMSEMALISARKARLQALADEGSRGAAEAIRLGSVPNRFLSTVQMGMTLIGILSGAFGGATLSGHIVQYLLLLFPALQPAVAKGIAVAVVVGFITFFSVVLGELVPKRLALHYSEHIASFVSRPMKILSALSTPIVWTFSVTTDFILKFFHVDSNPGWAKITHEEIRDMVKQGEQDGVLDVQERKMMERVLAFGKKRVTAIMTLAHEIVYIDATKPLSIQLQRIADSRFSVFPVVEGTLDKVLGTINSRDVCKCAMENNIDISLSIFQPLFVPESVTALQMLELFQETGCRIGFVVDEFGAVEGLVTMTDIARAIVGDVPYLGLRKETAIVRRTDGSFLIDGSASIVSLKEMLTIDAVDGEKENLFQTVAGFVMHRLGRVPKTADSFLWCHWRFEVVDMDKNRVDKVLVSFQAGSHPSGHHVPSGPTTQPTK
jgi:putative hemolysin